MTKSLGLGYHSCKAVLNALYSAICLARSSSNSTQVMDMIEACPTCLGYVFSEIQATVKYYTNILPDVDGFVS